MARFTETNGPWVGEDFWVSPFDFEPSITNRPNMPARVKFHDATLRDGEQTPGVVFRREEKLAIARLLDKVGVDRIEAGMVAVSAEDRQAITDITNMGLKAEVTALCRGMESDIDLALSCGLKQIIMELPTGVPRLKFQYTNWTEDHVIDQAVRVISYAKNKGLRINYFLMDSSRGERSFLERMLARVAKDAPPDAITVVDTAGCLLPDGAAAMVKMVREVTGLPVEIHCHNDMGLGVANTLAALEAGAETAHVCINGLGERSGNIALDELAIVLNCLYGMKTGINLGCLTEVSRTVSELSGIPIHRNKPVVGDGTFCRESGLGVELVKSQPLALFSIVPSLAGQQGSIVLGKKSGIASIQVRAQELGITGLTDAQMRTILDGVKQKGIEKKGVVSDQEFRQIVNNATAA